MMCVYKLSSKINPLLFYVGSTSNFKKRQYEHLKMLIGECHKNINLQQHFNDFGIDDFIFSIIEVVNDKSKLIEREQYYIDGLKPFFNIHQIADRATGVKRRQYTKTKISISKKGVKHNPIHSLKKSNWMKGKQNSLGFKHSDEAKINISNNNPRRKEIKQFDLNGNFIKKWHSIKEASTTLNIAHATIGGCLKGKFKHAGKYKWIYE